MSTVPHSRAFELESQRLLKKSADFVEANCSNEQAPRLLYRYETPITNNGHRNKLWWFLLPIIFLLSHAAMSLYWKSIYTVAREGESPNSGPSTASSPQHHSDGLTGTFDCGENATEARHRGCEFDVMSNGWLHPACRDIQLSESYLEDNTWTWYRDRNRSEVITLEEMRIGKHEEAFVNLDWHYRHCLYNWEKLIRAVNHNGPFDSKSMEYHHAHHCGLRLLGVSPHSVLNGTGSKATENREDEQIEDLTEVLPGLIRCVWPSTKCTQEDRR